MQRQNNSLPLVDAVFNQTAQTKNPFKFELGTKVFAYDAQNRQIIQGDIEARLLEESEPSTVTGQSTRIERYKVWATSHPQFSKDWRTAAHVELTAEALVHLFLHQDEEITQAKPNR